MRRSQAPYWDLINGRQVVPVYYSKQPPAGIAMTFLGPIGIPATGEKKEEPKLSPQDEAEATVRAERKAAKEKALREIPDYEKVTAELDAEFARKKAVIDAAGEMSKSVLWRRLHDMGEAVKKAGLINRKIEWSAHLFRRTFATLLFKSGMDVKALQLATRHASIETLAKHYLDSAEPTSGRFDEILEGVI